jgi:2-(1,2-epoxy-1,2-dihydrophenyl)acetyl-CoA isomerase
MPDARPILFDRDGELITITLNRPASLNAIDLPLALALHEAIEAAAEACSAGARVLLLRGAGRSFCGGGDVAAMHAHRADLPGFIGRIIDAFHLGIMALARLPIPVVAGVHGAVAGGGFSLALAADLVVATRSTRFVVAYPQLGAPADGGLSFRLAQRLGAKQGLAALTLHGRMNADEALAFGLINRVVDAERADDEALQWAHGLVALPPQSVNELKGLVAAQSLVALEEGLAREKAAFLRCAATADFAARVEAFVNKTGA